MKRAISIFGVFGFVLTNTLPRWVPHIDGGTFCKWQAISYVLVCLSALTKQKDKETNILFTWAFFLALNNAFDEVFGNPYSVSFWEKSFATLVTIWTIYEFIKCRKHRI